jgi:septum formation protein
MKNYRIILASKSPRRQFLLREIGIDFDLITKDVNEDFPEHLFAEEIPLYLCRKKAAAFEKELGDGKIGRPDATNIVITADTVVWINDHVLNKPADAEEAATMLLELSGNKHEVYTGVCLKSRDKEISFGVRSDVYFRELHLPEIEEYIRKCNPLDKAGSYGAQECLKEGFNPCSAEEIAFLKSLGKESLIVDSIASREQSKFHCVEKINGSYFNVMGLPIVELYRQLSEF